MMQHTKKELERLYFDSFVQKVSDFPFGEIEHNDSPDFLIRSEGCLLGVEVTSIFCSHQIANYCVQQAEAEEQIIVELASKMAVEQGLPSLAVDIHFSSYNRPQKKDRNSIAKKLVEIVASKLNTEDVAHLDLESYDGLPSVIDFVSVYRTPWSPRPVWQPVLVGFAMEDCVGDIQKTIDTKNSKLSHYKKQCSACWLLIVANWFQGPSAFYEPSEQSLLHEYITPFDRVYFLELFSGRVRQLTVCQ